jgi:hypothetical protein
MQKFVFRSALRSNQISFSHDQDPSATWAAYFTAMRGAVPLTQTCARVLVSLAPAGERKRINAMNHVTIERERDQTDETSLNCGVSDEALEAAAEGVTGRLMLSWTCPWGEN